MLAYLLPGSGPRFCIGPGILVSAYPQGVKGVRHKVPETTMKPRKESVLETPKKLHPHRITVTSTKRAEVEAEEQVADDVVQADRVPEVDAVVVASCGAGSVGGMVSEAAWYYKRVSKKPLKKLRAAAGKKGDSVDAKTARMHESWMLRYYDIEGK